ncbi:unnamed protein product [Caenorhabditis angaria]|uniref:Major facilitator superfamily (MFS) profile domain-containing protein n=1 Tax=Caenorhabditis angaria TaxID=860376 RepID=A0A9P1J1I6_9PELO|nr:unnamed protein product [Caenorhabditis angaria]
MQITSSIWPVIFYSTDFLLDVGFSYSFAEIVSTTMLFVSSTSTFIGMFIVEKFPRKRLLILTAIVNVASLLVFSLCVYFKKQLPGIEYGCVVTLITHGISYSVALGPIAWFITSELVPMSCRAVSQSLALAINHFFALILAFLTFPLYKSYGSIIIIIFYVLPGIICIKTLHKYLPETKDKHINEVVKELKNENEMVG